MPPKSIRKLIDGHFDKLAGQDRLCFENEETYDYKKEDFIQDSFLGSSQSEVIKYYHKPSKKFLATKLLRFYYTRIRGNRFRYDEIRLAKIAKEIEIYKKVSKDSAIVKFYGWTVDTDCCRIFMEPMKISLENAKRSSGLNDYIVTYEVILSVLDALETCKQLEISHGDLKPDNIMINAMGQIKLGDFGESHHLATSKLALTGALAYWSPEKFDQNKARIENEERFNVWSLGIIALETYLGENLMLKCIGLREFYELPEYQNFFLNTPYEELIRMITRGYDYYSMGLDLEEFIMLCIQPIEKRPNYEELFDSKEYQKILEVMEYDEPGDLKVGEIVRNFIQRVNEPLKVENESSKNVLNFPNSEQTYEFIMSNLKLIQPDIRPRQETRRYKHKTTDTLISLSNKLGWSSKEEILKEIALLKKFSTHPNIILCYGWCEDLRIEYLCFETMDIDLFQVLITQRPILYENILRYIAKILVDVIFYLNSHGYAHGNINPETVLFNIDGAMKVSGFEYSWNLADLSNMDKKIFLKEHYVPPERIFNKFSLDYRNDIWALGTMLLDCALDRALNYKVAQDCGYHIKENYPTNYCKHTNEGECKFAASKYYKGLKFANDWVFNSSPSLRKFVAACIKDLKNRPTIEDLMKFKFYKEHHKHVQEDREVLVSLLSNCMSSKVYSVDEGWH